MTKEKLFTPEDFDKPKVKNFWQKYKGWILGLAALLIVVAVVIFCIFFGRVEQKESTLEKEQLEQVSKDSDTSAFISEGIEDEIGKENAGIESESASAPATETRNNEDIKDVSSSKGSSQFDRSSDNIELEAMNVIRGDYGNVPERRVRLGSKYQEIQNRVNQLKKEGIF